MKLEIGGGACPNGDGWVNIDLADGADVHHDLNVFPWPFADDSVSAIYSSHCLEHLADPLGALREMARIGRIGAPIELRVPHPASHQAMGVSHLHVFSPIQAINMDVYFPKDFWIAVKRPKLLRIEYAPTFLLEEAKRELPFLQGISDESIMKWIPGTCHESRFFYTVVQNEFHQK